MYRQNTLYCEDVALADIARREGTPCFVYSKDHIAGRLRMYDEAFGAQPHRICYAVKANSNLAILKLVSDAGAGFDLVSGGELFRVIRAGGDPAKVVFSGVGKTAAEIEYALETGIHSFNCESEAELTLIDSLACLRSVEARVAVRDNRDMEAGAEPYISPVLSWHNSGFNSDEDHGVC